eukprot:1167349-Rhodomonas_salina.1
MKCVVHEWNRGCKARRAEGTLVAGSYQQLPQRSEVAYRANYRRFDPEILVSHSPHFPPSSGDFFSFPNVSGLGEKPGAVPRACDRVLFGGACVQMSIVPAHRCILHYVPNYLAAEPHLSTNVVLPLLLHGIQNLGEFPYNPATLTW